ncbi:MAG: outer membrane beta-barrel protein [Nibricoccus sp.]
MHPAYMKNLARGFAVLACLASTASAITRVGESAELFITGTVSARTDDNIFLTDLDEVDDTIFDIAPGLKLSFGQGSQTTGSLEVVETFTRYLDNDNLNDELLSAVFGSSYDDSKLKLDFDASYLQLNQSTRDVRGTTLIRRDVIDASLDSEINVSDKSSTGLGISYIDTDYDSAAYTDLKEVTVPFNYYYAISSKVDLSAGLRYRQSTLSGNGVDSKDYYYNIGARSRVTEKLSGFFSVGFNQRKPETGGDETSTGLEAELKYKATEKTTIGLSASNDYTTSAEGISQKTFTVAPSVSTMFSAQWEGSVGFTYQKLEYFSGRKDDYIDGRLGLAYHINDHATLTASYNYRSNDSNLSYKDGSGRQRDGGFDNSIISLSALLSF